VSGFLGFLKTAPLDRFVPYQVRFSRGPTFIKFRASSFSFSIVDLSLETASWGPGASCPSYVRFPLFSLRLRFFHRGRFFRRRHLWVLDYDAG